MTDALADRVHKTTHQLAVIGSIVPRRVACMVGIVQGRNARYSCWPCSSSSSSSQQLQQPRRRPFIRSAESPEWPENWTILTSSFSLFLVLNLVRLEDVLGHTLMPPVFSVERQRLRLLFRSNWLLYHGVNLILRRSSCL